MQNRDEYIKYQNISVNETHVNSSEVISSIFGFYIEADWDHRRVDFPEYSRIHDQFPGPWQNQYLIICSSITSIRSQLALYSHEGSCRRLDLIITGTTISIVEDYINFTNSRMRIEFKEVEGGHLHISVQFNSWMSVHAILCDLLVRSPTGTNQLPLRGVRLGINGAASSRWAPGDPLARWTENAADAEKRPNVSSVDAISLDGSAPRLIAEFGQYENPLDESNAKILEPVDIGIFSPIGFNSYSDDGYWIIREGHSKPNSWTISSEEGTEQFDFSSIDEALLRRLRFIQGVVLELSAEVDLRTTARLITRLIVAGVPVECSDRLSGLAEFLPLTIIHQMKVPLPPITEKLAIEDRSIEMRRMGIKHFSPHRRICPILDRVNLIDPSVTIVLVSKRQELVPRILRMIDRQTYQNLDICLAIHDSNPIEKYVHESIHHNSRKVTLLKFEGSTIFGNVLNAVTEHAGGQIISKMDDDDWYGPHHIEDLVYAKEYSGAEIVGSPVEFTYLESIDITTRRSFAGERYTNHVAGGTLTIDKADLITLGGWRAISSAVDIGLIEAARAAGMRIYRNHGRNYTMYRRADDERVSEHTWKTSDATFLEHLVDQWDGPLLPIGLTEHLGILDGFGRRNNFRSFLARHLLLE